MICSNCTAVVVAAQSACHVCGAAVIAQSSGAMRPAKLVPIGEVKAGGVVRVKIGGNFDRALSGGRGIPLKKVFVMTGMPGSGKSTVLQQCTPAYLAAMPGRYVYYVSFEQDPSEVRATFETVLGSLPDRLMVPDAMDGGGQIDPEDLRRFPPILIIVDSVSRAVGKDLNAGVEMVQYYKKLATAHNCIVFCIFHANKQEDVAGKMAAIHDVDALACMSVWVRGDPVQFQNPDFRCLVAVKNRGDASDVVVWYRMTGKDRDGRPDASLYHGLEEVPEKAEQASRSRGLPGSVLELQALKDEFKEVQADWRERLAQAEKHVLSLAAKPEKPEPRKAAKRRTRPRSDDAGA